MPFAALRWVSFPDEAVTERSTILPRAPRGHVRWSWSNRRRGRVVMWAARYDTSAGIPSSRRLAASVTWFQRSQPGPPFGCSGPTRWSPTVPPIGRRRPPRGPPQPCWRTPAKPWCRGIGTETLHVVTGGDQHRHVTPLASANASGDHGHQSTGLPLCCSS